MKNLSARTFFNVSFIILSIIQVIILILKIKFPQYDLSIVSAILILITGVTIICFLSWLIVYGVSKDF